MPKLKAGRSSPIVPAAFPRCTVSPCPNPPPVPCPQHLMLSSSKTAQTCFSPTARSFAVRPVPRFTVGRWSPILPGASPKSLVDSEPSMPWTCHPQHFTEESSNLAHTACSPPPICSAVLPVPKSTRGRLSPMWLGEVPRSRRSPWPNPPFEPNPKHFTLPLVRSTHVK